MPATYMWLSSHIPPVPSFSPSHIPSLLTKEGSPFGKHTKMLESLMCFFDDSALILPPYLHFIFLGSKITADDDSSHEIKRSLLLGRNAMTNLDSVLKSRNISLPTKVHLVKAMVLPVVMYKCESWTIKKAEHWRIDAFEIWCWRRLLRVPWTARRSNQPIWKETNSEYSLEGLMLKLKF